MAEPEKKQQIDVISVGDTVIDDFVRLFDENGRIEDKGEGDKWLSIPYGTKLPFESSKIIYGVGNAANAAVNFAKMGLDSALVTNLGADENGRRVIETLQKKKVDTFLVKMQRGKSTNYHYVLWYKEDRTILINHEHYDYHWPHLAKSEIPKWLYFSSIAENAVEMAFRYMEGLRCVVIARSRIHAISATFCRFRVRRSAPPSCISGRIARDSRACLRAGLAAVISRAPPSRGCRISTCFP